MTVASSVLATSAPGPRRRVRRDAAALAAALLIHAGLLALALAFAGGDAPALRPAAPLTLALAPPPPVPPPHAPRRRAGGSPASAPKRARPASPRPQPRRAPSPRVLPPTPVEPLPIPPPVLAAPVGSAPASPVTGAGASAGTGAQGVGAGSGPGGPGGSGLTDPDWMDWPQGDEVDRRYPRAAYEAGRGGSVVLRCRERTDGRVDGCRVLSQTPPGEGFGRAALDLSRFFRFRPLRIDGRPAETTITIPYDFAVDDDGPGDAR